MLRGLQNNLLLLLGDDGTSVDGEVGAGGDEADDLLVGEVLEAGVGEGHGDLEAVGEDGRGDDLVLGNLVVELLDEGLVPHDGVVEGVTGLTLVPLLGGLLGGRLVGVRQLLGSSLRRGGGLLGGHVVSAARKR